MATILLTGNNFSLRPRRCSFHRQQSGGVYTWCNGTAWKRGKRILRSCLGVIAGAGASCAAFLYLLDRSVEATSFLVRPPSYPWDLEGYLTSLDHAAVRRGWQVYRTVCSTCHSLGFVRFMDLTNVSHTEVEVKAIAAEYEIQDGPDEEGNYYKRPGRPSDLIPPPYPNEEAARAANSGAYPPDLTYVIETRRNGRNQIFSFLTGWMDPPAGVSLTDNQHFNPYFLGNITGMAQMLTEGAVEYDDGTPSTCSQMAKDVVHFLSWSSAQEFDQRKQMFIKGMGILVILTVALFHKARYQWSYMRSRQIAYVPRERY